MSCDELRSLTPEDHKVIFTMYSFMFPGYMVPCDKFGNIFC